MFDLGIVEIFVLLLLPVAAVLVAGYLIATARGAADLDQQVARARRHQIGTSVLAGGAALAIVPVGNAVTQEAVLPVLPSVMVATACAVLWLGEVTFPRPSGVVRSTVLNPRGLGSVIPRGWLRLCGGLAALDLVLFLAGALTADDGRQIGFGPGNGDGVAGPYPGLSYVVPQFLALTIAALVAWGVCRSATTRPTIASDLEADAVLRRASGGRVLRWLAWGLLATAAGDLLTGGSAWQDAAPDSREWIGAVASVLGAVLAILTLALPLVPVARLNRRPDRATVGAR